MVRLVEGSFTTLLFDDESVTITFELVFAGNPAESSVSTSTVPVAEGLTSCEPGTGMTFKRVARPLGFTVATWEDAALRPTEDAEIEVQLLVLLELAPRNRVPAVAERSAARSDSLAAGSDTSARRQEITDAADGTLRPM